MITDLNLHVDLFVSPEIVKQNPFVRLPKNLDYSIIEIPLKNRSEILKNEKILNYKHIPPEEFTKKVAECEFIFSSALHGIICADSLGIPNRHIILTPDVGTYKFQDYYSVFKDFTYNPIDLGKNIVNDSDLKIYQDSFQDRTSEIDNICSELLKKYDELKKIL